MASAPQAGAPRTERHRLLRGFGLAVPVAHTGEARRMVSAARWQRAQQFESGRFDLTIIENCIDHVRDVSAGMREVKRVLSRTGALYLTVNCRTAWGFVMHRALSRLRVDAGHPHTFTPRRAGALLRDHGFTPLQFEVGSYAVARREDLAARELRARIKAVLGVSEFLVSAVAQQSPAQ